MNDAHQSMSPPQYKEYVHGYITAGVQKIREATVSQLASELREPSTNFQPLLATIQNEALARILEVCAL